MVSNKSISESMILKDKKLSIFQNPTLDDASGYVNNDFTSKARRLHNNSNINILPKSLNTIDNRSRQAPLKFLNTETIKRQTNRHGHGSSLKGLLMTLENNKRIKGMNKYESSLMMKRNGS